MWPDLATITGTYYVRHLFKIASLQHKKSEHLLDFNFHLSRWPSSGTTELCFYTTGLPHLPTYAHTPVYMELVLRQTPTMVCVLNTILGCAMLWSWVVGQGGDDVTGCDVAA